MPSKQILPYYVDNYTKSEKWSTFVTPHYIFHFFKSSVAEREIVEIAQIQEVAHAHILKKLELNDSTPIKYFLYPTEEDKETMMGDGGNAQAIWHDFSIHAIYNEKTKSIGAHEDTHLLTLILNDSPIGFFQEGLAEYMSGCVWHGNDATPLAHEAIARHIYDAIDNIFSHTFWTKTPDELCMYYYPLAGLFTKYLFDNFDSQKYIKVYSLMKREFSKEQNKRIFENEYGDVHIIENNFLSSVRV